MIGNIWVFYIVTVGANAVINNRFKQQNHILKLKKLNSRSYGKFVDYSAFFTPEKNKAACRSLALYTVDHFYFMKSFFT